MSEPHALLGLLEATVVFDWAEAANRFQLAMTRQPVTPWVRWMHGQYLMQVGRFHDAVDQMERALQDDPLHVLCRCHLAGCLHAMGRQADAWRQWQQVLDIDKDFWVAQWYRAVAAIVDGALPQARTAAERAYALMPKDKMNVGLLAGLLSREEDATRAAALLAELRHGEAYAVPMGSFMYHFARSETDLAAAWLEKAIELQEQRVMYVLPYMRVIARWPAIARKLNLPEGGHV
jgi:tetratricopeptide (TPR) repeat protein